MKIVFIILSVALFLVLCFFLFRSWLFTSYVVKRFKKTNVIVFGKKGSGKDLVFQKVINVRKKEGYYSNLTYGNKFQSIKLGDVSVFPNTFENFINDNVRIVSKKLHENEDIYLSDCGVYLPSQYDSLLDKRFPSLPIYYALSRHLSNSNVHCNTQALSRVWKKLREQADTYIRVKKTFKLPFILITQCYVYDKFSSAESELEPVRFRLGNEISKAEVDIYRASNGEIKKGYIIQFKASVKYDTRAFHEIVYGIRAPLPSKKCRKRRAKRSPAGGGAFAPSKDVGNVSEGA